ncbi:MAG: alpha/beta hydrolase [Planctomycetota bacterium]
MSRRGPLAVLLVAALAGSAACGGDRAPPPPPDVVARGAGDGPPPAVPSAAEPVPDSVTVLWATDRARFAPDAAWYARRFLPAAVALAVGAGLAVRMRRMLRERYLWRARAAAWLTAAATLGLAAHGGLDALRAAKRSARLAVQYGDERLAVAGRPGLPLETGLAQVTIPPHHVVGEVERPSVWRGDLFEDPQEHMVVHGIAPQPEDAWFTTLRDVVAGSDAQDAFVFVHGYNVTFEEALLRTAQIAYDLKFRGAPICFSWPSQGGVAEYTVDEANVRWATPHLERFLVALKERSGAARIHLIAHSMGNRALTETLQRLRATLKPGETLFHEIVLAAPDVDADTFRDDLAPALLPTASRVTLYASSRDAALQLSRKVHGYPRAGEAGDGLVVVPGLETVDVSEVSGSHSYIGNNGRVLDDLGALLLRRAKRAAGPGLVAQVLRGLPYWRLQGTSR